MTTETEPGTATHRARRGSRARQRRDSRACAVQLLYSFDQKHEEDDGLLIPEGFFDTYPEDVRSFAWDLFTGYRTEQATIDTTVEERLRNWSLQRLAVIDRSILRLGAFELVCRPDTPLKVIINEYIELAKIYGSEGKTAKLVNGVLDRVGRDCRPQG